MTDPELLPCPFCGGKPERVHFGRKYDFNFAIECECGACLSSECGGAWEDNDEAKTIAAWNRRAPP